MHSLLKLLVLALVMLFTMPIKAEGDHDKARRALESGQVLSLQQILQKVSKEYPAQVIEVELEREKNLWIYEITQLASDGTITKLEVDAKSGAVIKQKSKKSKN